MDWKARALAATNGSKYGAILAAALGKTIPAPHFNGRAGISSDGFVLADFTDAEGNEHPSAFVGSAADLATNTLSLAEYLKLSPEDRSELFATVRGWIANDYSNGALKALTERLH